MKKRMYLAPQTVAVEVKFESQLLGSSPSERVSISVHHGANGSSDDEGDGESE